jgi:hypothetical protein
MSAGSSLESGVAASPRARVGVMERAARLRLELVCFPLVAAVYAAHLFASGYDRFYYDSEVYWQLGGRFEHNGHFSLLDYREFPGGYPRGYSLPLLNHFLHEIASGLGIGSVTVVKLFGALLAATLGVIVAPRLARRLFPSASIRFGSVLALNALIFLYWRDHFDFPLSDFPALLAATVGLLGLLRATPAGFVVAGLGFGLADNIRPAYLLALVGALAAAALLPFRTYDWRRRSAATALVVAGALIAFLPQMLINHHQRGNWSPFPAGGKDIGLLQLSDGMKAQRYETYVGPTPGYPQPQVFYLDPATQHVLGQEHISKTKIIFQQNAPITSYGQYAGIVFRHPAEMAASYVRRVFNGLDVWYPTPYVRDLSAKPIVLSLLLYTLMFLAVARLFLADARRALGGIKWVGIVLLLSASLTAVPGAVEPRFFLPVQLLIYMLVCFAPATRASFIGGSVRRRIGLTVSYAAFVLVCLTLSSETLAQIEHPETTVGLGPGQSAAASLLLNQASQPAD